MRPSITTCLVSYVEALNFNKAMPSCHIGIETFLTLVQTITISLFHVRARHKGQIIVLAPSSRDSFFLTRAAKCDRMWINFVTAGPHIGHVLISSQFDVVSVGRPFSDLDECCLCEILEGMTVALSSRIGTMNRRCPKCTENVRIVSG